MPDPFTYYERQSAAMPESFEAMAARMDQIAPAPNKSADEQSQSTPPPRGFTIRQAGVFRDVEGGEPVWICAPIRVLALPRDAGGNGWGRLVEFPDPDGRLHRWAIPATLFAGDGTELRAGLLDRGLNIAPGRAAREALAELLLRWQPPARAVTTDRLGWTDETCTAFALGDGQVLGASEVVFQSDTAPAAAAEMRASGTVEGWRDTVAAACAGNPLMLAAVSLAFAGPLLEVGGMDGGGIHLRGASSRGKSTIQRAAVSVWGSPRFLHSWRATTNGLEGVAACCNSTLLALDELAEVSGREAGAAAYMLANGVGKARANRSGAARAAARWRVSVISSGEITLADKVAEGGGRAAAGQTVRLLDVAADTRAFGAFDDLHGAADGAAFADRMKMATAQHFGTAGPAFVARLLADRDDVATQVRTAVNSFREAAIERFNLEAEGQTARAAARMGLVAAAGELATAWGLTGWKPGAARDAALEVFAVWLAGRGGGGSAEAREAVARTRAFLVTYGESRFEPVTRGEDHRPVINRAGWRDGDTFFIATDAWADIHRGADPKRAAKHVHEAGFLDLGDGRNVTQKLPRTVHGRPRAYAIRAEIMGAGDD